MQAVILVGGLGTRLRPLTYNRPKPLLPIINQPFLAMQLQRLRNEGIDEIILAVQYLADQFVNALGDGSAFDLRLQIVEEPTPRGTAGAVKHIAHLLDNPTLILNGDTVTDLDLGSLTLAHRQSHARLTLALTEVDDPTSSGMVECEPDQRVRRFVEKPSPAQVTTRRINAGSYVIDPALLDRVPAGRPASFERDLFPALIAEGAPVYGYYADAYVGDFGTPATYLAVHEAILSGRMRCRLPSNQWQPGIWLEGNVDIDPGATLIGPIILGDGVRINAGAHIVGPTVLGEGCLIGPGAQVEEAVLWNDVHVEAGAIVRHSILGSSCQIGRNTLVEEIAVLGDGCTIGDDNHLARGIRLWPGVRLGEGVIRF